MAPFRLIIALFICMKCCYCIDIFSGLATAVGITAFASYKFFKCQQYECCNDDWIRFDESKLVESLRNNLFGQHLVESTVIRTLHGFLQRRKPKKALVMSFNGLTGNGKNYVANMIANSTYKEGTRSSFVHFYSGVKDFPHKQQVSRYQEQLQRDIIDFTMQCERSLFIFDEIDKMPPGTLDALKPFIDYHEILDGVDYRKNIFIFLSNAGSSSITQLALTFFRDGRDRKEMTIRDIEPLIAKGAFNEYGGFQFSDLLRSELIDVFVPFLPLEKEHVKQCIEAELKARNAFFDHQLVKEIANDLIYFPPEIEIYSKSGCKRISQKVDLRVD